MTLPFKVLVYELKCLARYSLWAHAPSLRDKCTNGFLIGCIGYFDRNLDFFFFFPLPFPSDEHQLGCWSLTRHDKTSGARPHQHLTYVTSVISYGWLVDNHHEYTTPTEADPSLGSMSRRYPSWTTTCSEPGSLCEYNKYAQVEKYDNGESNKDPIIIAIYLI